MSEQKTCRRQFAVQNETETAAFGELLGRLLTPGLVIALVGDLGAGKTRLVQSIVASSIDKDIEVTSPTFVLIHEYAGADLVIYHFDAYRLKDIDEFLDLGVDELFHGDNVCIIEWADKVPEAFRGDVLWIKLEITGTETRQIELAGTGERACALLGQLDT
ncbi:MAG: tRNA (adenosine(37)-N6)-threonylcarbamoyltransferase complex ATPase subunit type 1 TsaE [Planctomycetota bacterium]|nr:tRNA (adenosine(37)-N6)-threonylcarbamoyltransferase complex ATPase subunit type 1 TsaE [Planctomycetota bacterium]MDA1210907.1 tRNA (adenosine(37)-N6)-threonylcarbamoyltransferase complex ATPase subunit type 1 TsaE [Planctomycetota bacterium]